MSPMPGITTRVVDTPRLKIHLRERGSGTPVLFVHGDTWALHVDATRGTGDWVDDLVGLLDGLGLDRVHVVGHSLGGVVLFGLVAAIPGRIRSATLVAPGSPWGFGGARGLEGTPIHADGAGSAR